jgi:glucose-1-phosphate thymidylyltransferase
MSKGSDSRAPGFVALIPAAGVASRLPELQSSKEMLPVPLRAEWRSQAAETGPVMCNLLRSLRLANISETRIILRVGKEDIPEHLSNGDWDDMNLRYEFTPGTSGVPETVAVGLADKPAANVLFGFPDILFDPVNAFEILATRLHDGRADVVLGVFPTENPAKMDMVKVEADSTVSEIDIKPRKTSLELTWILAAWRPSFTMYLLDVHDNQPERLLMQASQHRDPQLGHILQLAIQDGLRVEAEAFEGGRSLDIGTPDDLMKAQYFFAGTT